MKKKQTAGVYTPMAGASIVVAVLATVMCDGGWFVWLGVVPALIMASKIKELIGD